MQMPQPGRIVDSHLKTILPSCPSPSAYRDRVGRAFVLCFLYPIILVVIGTLRPCPFIFPAFGEVSIEPLSEPSWPVGRLTGSLSALSGQ